MSNTESRVCSPIGFSTVKVTGMIIRGEKSEHKNICRASNETPQKSLDPKFLFWISNPKKNCHERSYNTGNINGNWIYTLLASTAGIRRISTKVVYTTFQIVVNTQKTQWFTKKIFTDNYFSLPYRVWLLSMGSTVTPVFAQLLLI